MVPNLCVVLIRLATSSARDACRTPNVCSSSVRRSDIPENVPVFVRRLFCVFGRRGWTW